MIRQQLSAPFSFLLLLALGFGTSIASHRLEAVAQTQPAAPITGNVHQTGAGLSEQAGPENIMIILDSSYSMGESLGSGQEDKMTAAKRTVLDVLKNIPPTTKVGLRVYGDSDSPFTQCRATSVRVPLGENNRTLIASKMIGIRPTGATPISYAIERSLDEDFRFAPGKKSIILISDGIETCGEDPCQVAVRMQQRGVNVKMNVVGFGLRDYEATKQLRCVALATKGKYYSANTAAELANSLDQAVAVETKVQGTILPTSMPPAQVSPPVTPTVQTRTPYQEKVLPAAVPLKPKKR